MEFLDKEVVKSKKESSNLSRSSICAILQQKCGHRVVQLGGVVCEEVKICLLREVTKKYVAAFTSVESQEKLLYVVSGRLPRSTHSSLIFDDKKLWMLNLQ